MSTDDIGYTEALAELDEILARLDGDQVDVDDLARQVRRAFALIEHCRARITAARVEVERVVVEGAAPDSLDPAATDSDTDGDRDVAGGPT